MLLVESKFSIFVVVIMVCSASFSATLFKLPAHGHSETVLTFLLDGLIY